MALIGSTFIRPGLARANRGAFWYSLMMVLGLKLISSAAITRATSLLLKSKKHIFLRWSQWLQMLCNLSNTTALRLVTSFIRSLCNSNAKKKHFQMKGL